MRDMELLSKADVMREYRYPKDHLDRDLASGKLPYFTSDDPKIPRSWVTRYYIPRVAVEKRLRELSGMEETA